MGKSGTGGRRGVTMWGLRVPDILENLMRTRVVWLVVWGVAAYGQSWDPGDRINAAVGRATHEKLKFSFEFRSRYEHREGQLFGRGPDLSTDLVRTRFGVTYKPAPWIKLSGLAQDGRAPWYGPGAPNSARDPLDVQEGYVELFGNRKTGWMATVGRQMINYGEGRLLGSPQWAALARTWDTARVGYRLPKAQFEFLLVSPIKVTIGDFNKPVLGDRIWGAYNIFPNLVRKTVIEAYILRHDQNRIGGFTGGNRLQGTDRLKVNTFGGRWTGALLAGWRYSVEGALQNGRVGAASHRAGAWYSAALRRWTVAGKPFDFSAEYKFASGTANPRDPSRVTTFDQLYGANHDKFGHVDVLGWRNIHNLRSMNSLGWTKAWTLNFMYDEFWLASKRDWLYNLQGRPLAQSLDGSAGRHVGREADFFVTYKSKHWQIGAGGGYFFQGRFVKTTTPGISPVLLYLFHTYSF